MRGFCLWGCAVADEADESPISALEDYPDFARALGMISVELAELEASLAEVLRALLSVDSDLGQAIYFTPLAVIPRIKFLMNVLASLHPDASLDKEEVKEIRKKLKSLCGRAEAAMGKRNMLLHAAWGVRNNNGGDPVVVYSSFPLREAGFKVIELRELKRVVTDIRRVNGDCLDLVELIDDYRKTGAN